MKFELLKSCPVCGSSLMYQHPAMGTQPRFRNEDGMPVGILTTYFRCLNCGVVFQNPRMTEESLTEYYASGQYRAELHTDQKNLDRDEKAQAERLSINILSEGKDAPKSHLDIGCSRGYLLREVDARFKVGVDLYKEYVEAEMNEFHTSLDDVSGKFELITMIHELEHELYPSIILKQVATHMNKNSTLMVEVPSSSSPGGPLRLAHTYYIEPYVLSRICEMVGLEVVGFAFTPHTLATIKRR